MYKIYISFFTLLLVAFLMIASGCEDTDNMTLSYFQNAELQYEGEVQKENIITALNDILTLPAEELKEKKYKDYTGKENEWSLESLIYNHFVPDKEGKTLGNNFYDDIKKPEAQEKVREILKSLQ